VPTASVVATTCPCSIEEGAKICRMTGGAIAGSSGDPVIDGMPFGSVIQHRYKYATVTTFLESTIESSQGRELARGA